MVRVFRPLPVEQLKLLVFDLDGTLIDSAQDLCNSVNAALEHVGRPSLPDPVIASFVGNGAPMLVRRSLALATGITPEQVDEELQSRAYGYFLEYYREHKPAYHTTEDGRWDYRVTIVYKNSTVATTANPDEETFIRQLWPDQATYQREEQRRFEILLAHWDLPVTDITPKE